MTDLVRAADMAKSEEGQASVVQQHLLILSSKGQDGRWYGTSQTC